MRKIFFLFTFIGIGSIFFAQTNHTINAPIKIKAAQALSTNSVEFIENKGQLKDTDGNPVPFVLFKAEANGVTVYVTDKGLSYVFVKLQGDNEKKMGKEEILQGEWNRVDMILKDASIIKKNIIKEGESADFSNYFYAHCPDGITNVHSYKKITIKEIYPGIDWVLYTNENAINGFIKQDFIVHADTDPNQLKLIYEGAGKFEMKNNQIHFENKIGEVQEGKLFCYQGNETNEINSNYIINKNIEKVRYQMSEVSHPSSDFFSYEVNIQLSNYDKSKKLIIDPQLVWSTFYGGSSYEGSKSIECDANGNVFVAGYNYSPDFPANTGGGYQGTFQGAANFGDVFILKLNNNGVRLWATNYGGTANEHGQGLCVDPNGNIYVTGYTESNNFPVLASPGAFNQPAKQGFSDAFILKFSNTGARLWATYYGGNGSEGSNDEQISVCSDATGNIFVAGVTNSNNFPTLNLAGAFFQGAYGGGNGGSFSGDAFISKFTNAGALQWSTYYGGSLNDGAYSICTDANGNLFVTGFTTSANFPLMNLAGAFNQAVYSGNSGGSTIMGGDAFILKFSNNGVQNWGTYYGGNGLDMGCAIITDNSGDVYVGGYSNSVNFPLLNQGGSSYYQGLSLGGEDAFLLKFNNNGVQQRGTFFGGSLQEDFFSYDNLAVDKCDNVYLVFYTMSADVPTQASCSVGFNASTFAGISDIFITQFSKGGSLQWATYFGGNSSDAREVIALDASNSLFISGEFTDAGTPGFVNAATYPLSNSSGGFSDGIFNGVDDVFLAKFLNNNIINANAAPTNTSGCGCIGSATASATGGCANSYQYYWYNSSWAQIGNSAAVSNLCAGTYHVIVKDSINCSKPDTVTVTVNSTGVGGAVPTVNAGPPLTLNCLNTSGIIYSGSSSPGVNYSWTGTGIVSGNTNDTATVNQPGTYTITVTDPNNGCTNTATVIVSADTASPNIGNLTALSLGCNITSGTISANSTTSGATFLWTGPGILSGGITNSPTVNATGTYTVTVTNPANGCTKTATVNVTNNGTLPNVSTTSPVNLPCNPNTVQLNATSTTSGINYSWSGPGIISGSTTNTPIVNAPGTYTVSVTDANNCTNTATVIVTNTNPLPNVTAGNPLTFACNQTQGTISVSSSTSGVTYNWAGPGIVSGGTSNAPIVNAAGTYTVTLTDPSNGCTNTATVAVNNTSGPIAGVSSNVTIQQGASTTLIATGGGTYVWFPSAGLNTTTGNTVIASPVVSFTYCVEVTDNNGCKDTACVTVTVETPCVTNKELQAPNAFSPNGDNTNEEFCLQGWNNCLKTFEILIYNRWGEKVYESKDPNFCWDGKLKNKLMDAQVFVYYIKASYTNSSETIEKKGNVSLIR